MRAGYPFPMTSDPLRAGGGWPGPLSSVEGTDAFRSDWTDTPIGRTPQDRASGAMRKNGSGGVNGNGNSSAGQKEQFRMGGMGDRIAEDQSRAFSDPRSAFPAFSASPSAMAESEVDALPAFLRTTRPQRNGRSHASSPSSPPVLPLTRSVLTALIAGLLIGGGCLFLGGLSVGVLLTTDPVPVLTHDMPPPLVADEPATPDVAALPPPSEPTAAPAAPLQQAPARPEQAQSGQSQAQAPVLHPPAPLTPSDLEAKPPESILSMLLTPMPAPPAPSVAALPATASRAPAPAPALVPDPTPAVAPVLAPVPVPAPKSTAAALTPPPKPQEFSPPPLQTAPAAPPRAQATPPAPRRSDPPPQPAIPARDARAGAEPIVQDAPLRPRKFQPPPAPQPSPRTSDSAAGLTVEWRGNGAGPAVGAIAPAAPRQGAVSQESVMDALLLPPAPVGTRVEVDSSGQRQTVSTRAQAAPAPASTVVAANSTRDVVVIRSGVFAQQENVTKRLSELRALGLSPTTASLTSRDGRVLTVVEVGRYPSRQAAAPVINRLKAKRLEVYVAEGP